MKLTFIIRQNIILIISNTINIPEPSVALFLSDNYNDTIYHDRNGNLIVKYYGQKYGILDQILLDNIQNRNKFMIYKRENNREFKFIGETRNATVIYNRSIDVGIKANQNELLVIRLTINREDIKNEIIQPNLTNKYKYKYPALVHCGYINNNRTRYNIQLGIYKII